MDVISYEYTKQRKDFGKHPVLGDSKVECRSISSDPSNASQWVPRQSTTIELDCIPSMSEHEVNTERFVQCNKGMCHTQGAWPKEVKTNELADKERYLRRIENLKEYQTSVRKLTRSAERLIQQNNAIDLYETYFEDCDWEHTTEPPSAKTVSVFRDPSNVKRAASKISWQSDGAPKLAVAYSSLQFQQMSENLPCSSYIWDVNSPNEPDFELIPQSPLCCLVYNPRSTDHIVGGCYNGLVGFWDVRKGNQPLESSIIEKSHHDPVYDICWVQSRTGNECCSVSTDGQMLWWDVRKLAAGPTDSMIMQNPNNETLFGGTTLEYRTDAGATRYLIGSEQGQVLLVDRKAKKDAASTIQIKSVYGQESGRHLGPVYGIQRHPIAPKYFMSVGDWTTKIWMEDLKTPIMTTRYDSAYLTGGCWSPTRPAVFFTTKVDGTLDIWDLFFKQNGPAFSTKVGESGLSAINVHANGQMVALGSVDGTTSILQISDGLAQPQGNEKQMMQLMFERETKREKNLEIRTNQKKREKNQDKKRNITSAKQRENDEKQDEMLREVENDFFRTIDMKQPDISLADEMYQMPLSSMEKGLGGASLGSKKSSALDMPASESMEINAASEVSRKAEADAESAALTD